MAWSDLKGGKYKGFSAPELIFKDPAWFFWAYDNKVHHGKYKVADDFEHIYKKSRKLKIPNRLENLEVRYYMDSQQEEKTSDRRFMMLEICRKGENLFWDNKDHEYITGEVIDFKMPWKLMKKTVESRNPEQLTEKDRQDYDIFVKKIQHWFFGLKSLKEKPTKEDYEAFFEDNTNFSVSEEELERIYSTE